MHGLFNIHPIAIEAPRRAVSFTRAFGNEALSLSNADGAVMARLDAVATMRQIAIDELARTRDSLIAAERDSRLGYESEMDYV